MAKVKLNFGPINEELSLDELSAIIKGLNLGLTYIYSHPKDFTDVEENDLRDVRTVLLDFYDDAAFGIQDCPEIYFPEKFSRSDYEHDIAVNVDDLPF